MYAETTVNIEELSKSIRQIPSSELDRLARTVLQEVARRGINEKGISVQVFIAAELLYKEDNYGYNVK